MERGGLPGRPLLLPVPVSNPQNLRSLPARRKNDLLEASRIAMPVSSRVRSSWMLPGRMPGGTRGPRSARHTVSPLGWELRPAVL